MKELKYMQERHNFLMIYKKGVKNYVMSYKEKENRKESD